MNVLGKTRLYSLEQVASDSPAFKPDLTAFFFD